MVAHQLTPELTQPSVLVEIDHGPPMGLPDGAERRVPGISQTHVSGSTASAATSPWALACHVCPEPGVGHCDAILTKKDNVGAGDEVPEYETVELPEESLISRRNFGSRDAISSTSTEVESIAVGPGVSRWGVCEKHQQDAPLVVLGVRSGHEDTQPEGRTSPPWTQYEMGHRVVPPLPGHAKASTELPSIMRSANEISPADFSGSAGDTKYRTTHRDRHQAVKSDGNMNVKFVIDGMEAAEGGRPFGFEKPENASHHDLTIRYVHSGGSEQPRSTGQEDAGEVEPPLSMSSAGSSLERATADPECITLATVLWITAYNLMTSHHEEQPLLGLAQPPTELLLNVIEAAVSCLRILLQQLPERNVRVRQCAGKVHCLLDDPG